MDHRIQVGISIGALLLVIILFGFTISNGTLTGATTTAQPACYDHVDCDDKIESTQDVCTQPGTAQARCVQKRS